MTQINNVIKGLTILSKYTDDVRALGGDIEVNIDDIKLVSEEDLILLKELHWKYIKTKSNIGYDFYLGTF